MRKQKKRIDLSIGRGIAASFIATSGALDSPFVLLDIGARDGINPRWLPLEPAMQVFGFDAIADITAPNARHHYFKTALGKRDGECRFRVPENLYEAQVSPGGSHVVPMAKLDTLWRTHALPPYALIGPAVALVKEYRELLSRRIDPDALFEKVMLSQSLAIEKHLPHLGLGLWTGMRRLAIYAARLRGSITAN